MDKTKLDKTKNKGKKGIATFLFSRIFIFALMIIIQVLFFWAVAYNAVLDKSVSYIVTLLQVLSVVYIVSD